MIRQDVVVQELHVGHGGVVCVAMHLRMTAQRRAGRAREAEAGSTAMQARSMRVSRCNPPRSTALQVAALAPA